MKKIKYGLLAILFFFACGCSKEDYSSYQHYDLQENNKIQYAYLDENGKTQNYYLADMTTDDDKTIGETRSGFFYQVGEQDFILLEEFYPARTDFNNKDNLSNYNYFYENKFYKVDAPEFLSITGYVLDKEKIEKKSLPFVLPSDMTYDRFSIEQIYKIEDNFLYLSVLTYKYDESLSTSVDFKCSLDNYNCEIDQKSYSNVLE